MTKKGTFDKNSLMINYELLSRSPIFRGLDARGTEVALSSTLYRVRRYSPGSVIALNGEEVTSLQIVISGLVKGEMVDFSGRVLKIEDIGAPRALAPAFLFGSQNRYPVNVTAVVETEIITISRNDFVKLLGSHGRLLTNYLDTISNRSQFLSEKIRFFTFKTIKSKLANYIIGKSSEGNNQVRFARTHQELADFFGVARPSLSRALSELERDGLIRSKGKNIEITDRPGLIDLIRQ